MDAYDEWLKAAKQRVQDIQDEYLDNFKNDKEGSTNMLKILQALLTNLEEN